MAKRNLNEVLEFISRWGDSRFSVIIKESTQPKSLKDRMIEDEDNSSVFYTSQLPRGARPRKPGEKEDGSILGGAMFKLGRMLGKTKNRVAPKGSGASKVLGGIGRVGKAIGTVGKAAFKGVGSDISDLLTSEEDYDYVYDEIDIPSETQDTKTETSPSLPDKSGKKLPAPGESSSSSKSLPSAEESEDSPKALPAPKTKKDEEEEKS